MIVITKLTVKKTSGLGYIAKTTMAVVSKFNEANSSESKIEIEMPLIDIFNNICANELFFTKQCNKGFWFLNARMVEKDMNDMGLNIQSVNEYYNNNRQLYFDVFGAAYNNFIERYEQFTKEGRKVVVTVG